MPALHGEALACLGLPEGCCPSCKARTVTGFACPVGAGRTRSPSGGAGAASTCRLGAHAVCGAGLHRPRRSTRALVGVCALWWQPDTEGRKAIILQEHPSPWVTADFPGRWTCSTPRLSGAPEQGLPACAQWPPPGVSLVRGFGAYSSRGLIAWQEPWASCTGHLSPEATRGALRVSLLVLGCCWRLSPPPQTHQLSVSTRSRIINIFGFGYRPWRLPQRTCK